MSRLPSRSPLGLATIAFVAFLAACTFPGARSTPAPAVRSDLVAVGLDADDASLFLAEYREWDAEGGRVDVELDHGHGPEAPDGAEPVVLARVGGANLPVQAVDAVGDRVIVDLDALPPGRQTLRLSVGHGALQSPWLEVPISDRQLAAP